MPLLQIEPLLAAAVVVATALTDAVYVLFTNAVVKRHRLPAATWSSVWLMPPAYVKPIPWVPEQPTLESAVREQALL